MTLGKKLSNYRKLLGITQAELGERLNMSAQAVSKWENDLAEPDLTTLKTLANLYKVSVDELLDAQARPTAQSMDAESFAEAVKEKLETKETIGFCKKCGITVTEETIGERTPVIKCKNCVKAEEEEARRAKAAAEKQRLEEIRRAEANIASTKASLRKKRKTSLIVAALVAAAVFIIGTVSVASWFSGGLLVGSIFTVICSFTFTAMLFYDTPVTDVVSYMCSASISWPGLIFTWDIDGFLWVIGMKILFAVLGFLFGIVCTLLGLFLGLIISPFVFVYIMVKFNSDIKKGIEGDYVL